MVGVSERGALLAAARVPTTREDLAGGVFEVRERVLPRPRDPARTRR